MALSLGKKPSSDTGLGTLHKCSDNLCRGFKDGKLRLAEAGDQVVNDYIIIAKRRATEECNPITND